MAVQAVIAENGRLDWLGVLCSFGCAVHCAAMPLVVATLPSLTSIKWLADPLFHQVVAVLCGALVARAILPSYRVHRDNRVLTMAGFGLSLLFVAAFILPNACCSGLQIEGSGASSQKLVESADFQGASESPKIVLVSSSGSTTGRFGFVQERNEGREHRPSEAKPSNRESGEAPELPASEMPYSEMPACEHDVCGHAMTYGRPLLSSVELASHLGISGAQTVIQAQPFLSPLGGLFLIIAHILNIRSRVCGRSKCCGAGQ